MDTTFMSIINANYYLIFQKKINLKRSDKHVALSNLSIYYKWRNFKKSYKNLKKNEELELLGGLYSVSNIQDYFEYILKKNGEKIDNP